MLGYRRFEKTIIALTAFAVLMSLVLMIFPNIFSLLTAKEQDAGYPEKLFGKNIINIDIEVDDSTWDKMIEDKMSKPYIPCDITIDGQRFEQVGLRPKGNSSLTSVQGERLSFRLNFDYYINNQTCYGLTKMVLNNLHADATYMKDYIAYDLMQYMGVNAPLHNYAFITLNGEPFGVYLAAEVYDEDYLKRVYGDTSYRLYNVKSSGFNSFESAQIDPETCEVISSEGRKNPQGMEGPGGPPPGGEGGMMQPPPMRGNMQPPNAQPSGMNNMPAPPSMGGSGGGDLLYTDNNTESYRYIFANSVFDNTDASDNARVIRAIKYLNKENVTQEELEKYWNIDEILRYFAVHNFMVNNDSYTGAMQQNYFIAEKDGKITILPWDYNLSFGNGPGGAPPGGEGGMMQPPPAEENMRMAEAPPSEHNIMNNADSIVNYAVDTPTMGVDMEDRPLVSVLLGFEEYKDRYHRYLDELTNYVPFDFIDKLEIVESDIYPYVQSETVKFFSSEEHVKAFEVLKKFLDARSESIQRQLSGSLAARTEDQNENDMVKTDFSVNDMGSMGGPGGGPGGPPQMAENRPGQLPGNGQGGMPPPPPGMNVQQQSSNGDAAGIISLLILGAAICGVIIFKRNY